MAIGAKDLVAFERGSSCRVVEARQDAAQAIGQVEGRAIAIQRPKQTPTQAVVVGIVLVGTRPAVIVLFQPEGVRNHGGAVAVGETTQHAVACRIVDIALLVVGPRVPLSEVVEVVVGERGRGVAEGAAAHIAKAVVATGIALPAFAGAGAAHGIQPAELVGLAIAVEVLVRCAAAGQRPLPQLTQVGVDKAVVVAGPI